MKRSALRVWETMSGDAGGSGWWRHVTDDELAGLFQAWAKEHRYFKIGPANKTRDEMAQTWGYVKVPEGVATPACFVHRSTEVYRTAEMVGSRCRRADRGGLPGECQVDWAMLIPAVVQEPAS